MLEYYLNSSFKNVQAKSQFYLTKSFSFAAATRGRAGGPGSPVSPGRALARGTALILDWLSWISGLHQLAMALKGLTHGTSGLAYCISWLLL